MAILHAVRAGQGMGVARRNPKTESPPPSLRALCVALRSAARVRAGTGRLRGRLLARRCARARALACRAEWGGAQSPVASARAPSCTRRSSLAMARYSSRSCGTLSTLKCLSVSGGNSGAHSGKRGGGVDGCQGSRGFARFRVLVCADGCCRMVAVKPFSSLE